MYEQLPTPFGLVRYGVAPDHPEVRHCETKLDEVAAHTFSGRDGASSEAVGFEFVGNVKVGRDVSLLEMRGAYDAIVLAYGASQDRRLGIPGENLSGVTSARAFVGWYNGLPEFRTWDPSLLTRGNSVVIVGQGNVSLDIARILLGGVDALRGTDMPEYALEALSRSTVRRVHIVGRRGLFQLACTLKELRELLELQTCAFTGMHPFERWRKVAKVGRARTRMHHRLADGSAMVPTAARKKWSLDFMLAPACFNARQRIEDGGQIGPDSPAEIRDLVGVDFEKTEFANEEEEDRIREDARVVGTGNYRSIEAQLAFRSIGYNAEALPGFEELGIDFDTRTGTVKNFHGRALAKTQPAESDNEEARARSVPEAVPGFYTAGWCKRGPTGVIASTMMDAFDTAETIAADWTKNQPFLNGKRKQRLDSGVDLGGWTGGAAAGGGGGGLKQLVQEQRGVQVVNWRRWKRIDEEERERGRRKGKAREKITDVAEMLEVADRKVQFVGVG